jgi:hypothetical protein
MPKPLFEFFEVVAEELCLNTSRVITRDDLEVRGGDDSQLLIDLQKQMKVATAPEAIAKAISALRMHFQGKGADLPFEYDQQTGRFRATDLDFLVFVREMRNMRSIGKRSRDFECYVAQWLSLRASGQIHRVGHPWRKKKLRATFNNYLGALGFNSHVLMGKEKDGGLDILWLLPLGTLPHRPIVSVQCKNGEFDLPEADGSLGATKRSLDQHTGLQPGAHILCVFFNDYVYREMLTTKRLEFVPLGLTDLAAPVERTGVHLL